MDPVRIKLYGLIPLTKGRYLAQQSLAVLMAAVLLVLWNVVPRPEAPLVRGGPVEVIDGKVAGRPLEPAPEVKRFRALWNAVPWIVTGLLFVIAVESMVVLRAFARHEREAAGQASPSDTPAEQLNPEPPEPSSVEPREG